MSFFSNKILLLTAWERQLQPTLETQNPESYLPLLQTIDILAITEEIEINSINSLYSLIPYHGKDIQEYLKSQISNDEISFEQKLFPLIAWGKQLSVNKKFSSQNYNIFCDAINGLLLSASGEEFYQVMELYKIIPLNEMSLEAYLNAQIAQADFYYSMEFEATNKVDTAKSPVSAYVASAPFYQEFVRTCQGYFDEVKQSNRIRDLIQVHSKISSGRQQQAYNTIDKIRESKEAKDSYKKTIVRLLPELPSFSFADDNSEIVTHVAQTETVSQPVIKTTDPETASKENLRRRNFVSFFSREETSSQPEIEDKVSSTQKIQSDTFSI